MTFDIEFTERAQRGVSETLDWIFEQSEQAAIQWVNGLEASTYSLRENPERFGFAPENGSQKLEVRQLHYGKRRGQFRVLFTIYEETVYILDVRHSAKLWVEPGVLDDEFRN